MFFLDASREAEIGKLDVATAVKENIVGFDVSVQYNVSVHSCVHQTKEATPPSP